MDLVTFVVAILFGFVVERVFTIVCRIRAAFIKFKADKAEKGQTNTNNLLLRLEEIVYDSKPLYLIFEAEHGKFITQGTDANIIKQYLDTKFNNKNLYLKTPDDDDQYILLRSADSIIKD